MSETLNWNCEMEVNLFHALRGHKPVGVNRHFHMVSIHEKLSSTYKKITAKQIWDYLSELYDLNALNESEILPFPNKELEFILPDTDFSEFRDKSFPRLNLPKQDVDKLDVKAEKSEKSDKHEKQEKSDKHEKHEKQDKHHEKQDKHHDKHDKYHEKQDKHHDKHDKHHDKQDKHEKGSDSGSSKSSKSESRHSTGTPVLNTPDNSPKRKRTRHTPSSTASPATPDAPPPKRRR